jgi:hypothetical protein
MTSNHAHSALATYTQVFPVLTAAQINRIRPFASLRHAALAEVLFEADAGDVPAIPLVRRALAEF